MASGLLILACWALPPAAGAAELREFAGTVVAVSGASLTVENRMGDRRAFAGSAATPVSGAKEGWKALRAGDPVIVYWDLRDEPLRAHRIRVLRQ